MPNDFNLNQLRNDDGKLVPIGYTQIYICNNGFEFHVCNNGDTLCNDCVDEAIFHNSGRMHQLPSDSNFKTGTVKSESNHHLLSATGDGCFLSNTGNNAALTTKSKKQYSS
jgi:hypothetical protein